MNPNNDQSPQDSFYGPTPAPQPVASPDQPPQQWNQPSPPSYQAQPYQPMQPSQSPPPIQPAFSAPQPLAPRKIAKGPFALLVNDWMKEHWRRVLLIVLGVILLVVLIFQIVYPNSRLLPGATVDGVSFSGMRKSEAAERLDGLYGDLDLAVYFGKNEAAFQTAKMKDIGIAVNNEARLNAINYPFYLRIIPGSFLWANSVAKPGEIEYLYDKSKIESYTQSEVYNGCSIPAKDATLKLIDSQLQVVTSVPGGTCDMTQFQQALGEVKPSADVENEVRIQIDEKPAKVDNEKARELADTLNNRLRTPMPMLVGSEAQQIPGRIVLSWLDFKSDIPAESIDNSSNQSAKLVYSVNKDRMKAYLDANVADKIVKKPGVSKISTKDFAETSRVDGAGGTEVDVDKIHAAVETYINNKSQQVTASTRVVGPTMVYTRSYTATSTGFSALLAQFAQDNPGTYGLAFTEISGVRNLRSANYRMDAKYPSGGLEGMYLGYAAIMDQSEGTLRPAEKIAGSRNVTECLKDMIEKSDADCRQGFYERFGHAHTTARGKELGLTGTTFAGKDSVTSVGDIHNYMVRLQQNQIARIQGGQKLLGYSKTIRASDGVPAGVNQGEAVGHIVGESGTLRHDSAIVNANKGTYVLTVLSDGSSWDNIAKLTKKVQDLKAVKVTNN